MKRQAVSACFVGTFIVGFWYRSMWIGSVNLEGLGKVAFFGRFWKVCPLLDSHGRYVVDGWMGRVSIMQHWWMNAACAFLCLSLPFCI